MNKQSVEIRLNGPGGLDLDGIDEICAQGCDFHLEMMNDGEIFIWLTLPSGEVWHVNLHSKKKINVMCEQAQGAGK